MKFSMRHFATAALAGLSIMSYAGTSASATIWEAGVSGGVYTYDLSLTNTGTTAIGTFWYSWIPGQDYLPATPTGITSGSGWGLGAVTGSGNSTDGKAIQWVASSQTLGAGDTLNGFSFQITAAPSVIFGDSSFHAHPPIGTSVVYEGAPFSGGSDTFVVQAVPEPGSFCAVGLGLLGLLIRRRKSS